MNATKFGKNFFNSTRGQVLKLLRKGIRTVDELASRIGVTDNAVRAHLATLERDGLVARQGLQPGFRKPHFNYELTADAEQLFPKAYSTLFNMFLSALKTRIGGEELEEIISDVARSLAAETRQTIGETPEVRAEAAARALESLGGAPAVENEDGKLIVRSISSCPFDVSVSEHPEVCRLAEAFLSEVTGTNVRERCQKGDRPQCSFEFVGDN
ncbi:MAG: ArsR family transcriptional regulator [Pyrinomonadaceae bacterium]|nr:ArsR family transcriptional regulator [Pyrinomonadaceae bacterium]